MSEEDVLPDDYPVYVDYWYLIDGKPVRVPRGGTVRELKHFLRAREVRRCNAAERGLDVDFQAKSP